jgi:hypothetical protein
MNGYLARLAQRTTELRRITRRDSSDVFWHLCKHGPYLTSISSLLCVLASLAWRPDHGRWHLRTTSNLPAESQPEDLRARWIHACRGHRRDHGPGYREQLQ